MSAKLSLPNLGNLTTNSCKSALAGFLESFHRVAFQTMLENDPQFKECLIPFHVEELQSELTELLCPFMDISTLKRTSSGFEERVNALLTQAVSFRTSCLPPPGMRYEIIHYQPGDVFNPNTMEAQDEDGNRLPTPDDGVERRVQLCVHGLMVAHAVIETSTGVERLKKLSQPFVELYRETGVSGHPVSEKATVILEETP